MIKDYLIQIGLNYEKLLFNIRELSSISNVFCEESLTLQNFQKLNEYFKFYDNIEEVIINKYDIFEE